MERGRHLFVPGEQKIQGVRPGKESIKLSRILFLDFGKFPYSYLLHVLGVYNQTPKTDLPSPAIN